MLKSYLTITLRHMRNHTGYAFINITGLAVGIACCLLILLYVQRELSFDRFHENADRIYRVTSVVNQGERWGSAIYPVGPALKETFPQVETYVRMHRNAALVTKDETVRFHEERFLVAEDDFFAVFDYELLQGNPETALTQPYTLVLTESMAKKYFGDANPMGQTLRIDDKQDYTITGILADPPTNAHIVFDFVGSFASELVGLTPQRAQSRIAFTYVLLRPDADIASLTAALPDFEKSLFPDPKRAYKFDFISLTDIHLYGQMSNEIQPQGDIRYIYLFTAIAFLILLIACINYMNLSTARSTQRSREVGLRKVVGAHRGQLVKQFLAESFLFVGLAIVLAVALVEILLPTYNAFMGWNVEINYSDSSIWLLLLTTLLTVGLLSGSYPAFFLSAFKPVETLKGVHSFANKGRLRKSLVVFQFAITVALLVSTLIIENQLRYVQTIRLGFDKEQVLVIPTENTLGNATAAFRNELLQHTTIEQVAFSNGVPGSRAGITFYQRADIEGLATTSEERVFVFDAHWVDSAYVETLGLNLLEGTNLGTASVADDGSAVLLNEAAVKHIGWEKPLGKRLGDKHIVTGVVEDFHFASLHEEIRPMILYLSLQSSQHVTVRLATADLSDALAHIEATWSQFVPQRPFAYHFLDDHFAAMYQEEQQLGRLFSAFAGLAILIACLGLFGLAAFTAEQRTKEIGVRKVLGATVSGLIMLLSKDFVKLVVIAFVLAAPLAYWAMDTWLANFAYRVSVGTGTFAVAALVALALALGTVSYQALRAALANPIESLRHE